MGRLNTIRAVDCTERVRVGQGNIRVRVEGVLGRLERRTQRRVLDPELINDRTTFLPTSIRFVCGRKRGIEQL